MAIKRPRLDPAEFGFIQETREQRRANIAHCQNSAQSKLDRIQESEDRENNRLRRIEQKITSGDLWLSLDDLMGTSSRRPIREDIVPNPQRGRQRLTEEFPTDHDSMIMEDYYDAPPSRTKYPEIRAPRRSLQEDMAPRTNPVKTPVAATKPVGPPWGVKKFLGETRGGDTVGVWKVVNNRTGSSIDKLFRIEAVARRVAGLFNESGDPNDPRAVSLIGVYDKRDRLLKEARQLEKSADGKPMKTERLKAIRGEINQLDYRLGI